MNIPSIKQQSSRISYSSILLQPPRDPPPPPPKQSSNILLSPPRDPPPPPPKQSSKAKLKVRFLLPVEVLEIDNIIKEIKIPFLTYSNKNTKVFPKAPPLCILNSLFSKKCFKNKESKGPHPRELDLVFLKNAFINKESIKQPLFFELPYSIKILTWLFNRNKQFGLFLTKIKWTPI